MDTVGDHLSGMVILTVGDVIGWALVALLLGILATGIAYQAGRATAARQARALDDQTAPAGDLWERPGDSRG